MSPWSSFCQRHAVGKARRSRSLFWQAPHCQRRHSCKRTSRRYLLLTEVLTMLDVLKLTVKIHSHIVYKKTLDLCTGM